MEKTGKGIKTNKTKQQIAGNFTNQEKYLLREENKNS